MMRKEFPSIRDEELRTGLGAFGFTDDMVFQEIGSLSGGQKVKLLLCRIMKHQPNVLILDEVTNHLDIIGRQTIEQLLIPYKGTIIFISHDRYFVNKLANCLLVFDAGNVSFYRESYTEYLEKKKKMVVENSVLSESSSALKKTSKYISEFKERSKLERKVKKLEDEIERLENSIQEYHQKMMLEEVYMDIDRSFKMQEELKLVESDLEKKMEEWEAVHLLLDKE